MQKIFSSFFFIVLAIIFGGCLVSEKNDLPDAARIRLLNAVPENNYTLAANDNALFTSIPYDSITPYAYAFPSFYNIAIAEGNNSRNFSARQSIQSGLRYSYFIFPDSSSRVNNITGFKYSIITDNERQAALTDSFYIRFLHYSPTAPILHISTYRQQGTSNIYDNLQVSSFTQRRFNDISIYSYLAGFQKLRAGNYTFVLRNLATADTAEVLRTELKTYNQNRFYTLYLEGFSGQVSGSYRLKVKIDSLLNTNN